jgi:LysR family transcriptional regulator, low CO2-responsive transcriptional regulator
MKETMAHQLLKPFHSKSEFDSYMKNPIDSRQLSAFVSLARTGSYTQTGKELFLTQSAISHSIKALERDMGCRLLDKVGKKIVLTQAGEFLLNHAEKILAEMKETRAGLEQLARWGQGRLRIAAGNTACQYLLPTLLREFTRSFPNTLITVEAGDTPLALQLFEANRIDMALCIEPKQDKTFQFTRIFADELVFVVSPLHPWAQEGKVNRQGISREHFVLHNRTSYTFRLVEEYFQTEGITLNPAIEIGNIEGMKEVIRLGLGIGVLPLWVISRELVDGTLISFPLGKRKLKRIWGILHRHDRRLALPEKSFISIAKRILPPMTGAETQSTVS